MIPSLAIAERVQELFDNEGVGIFVEGEILGDLRATITDFSTREVMIVNISNEVFKGKQFRDRPKLFGECHQEDMVDHFKKAFEKFICLVRGFGTPKENHQKQGYHSQPSHFSEEQTWCERRLSDLSPSNTSV